LDKESPDPFLRRRAVALTLITALIVIPAAILLSQLVGGGGGGGRATTTGSRDVVIPATPHRLVDRKAGISISWPDGWRQSRKAGTIKLISRDKTTALLIAASQPATPQAAKAEYKNILGALQQAYRHPKVELVRVSQPLAGLPTASAFVTGRNTKGNLQRVGVIVARGRKHVYIVEVIAPTRGGRLGDIAVMNRRLQLTG
jgi:hypothetical protein